MKPPRLSRNATVGIIAPGSAPKDLDDLERGVRQLEAAGLEVVRGRERYESRGFMSGTDDERAEEINRFIRDEQIDALFCARGGYGTMRILDRIDYRAAQHHPKLVVGYSDITALQLALFSQAGMPSLSGPMVAVDWAEPVDKAVELFWELAEGGVPDPLLGPDEQALSPMNAGTAQGVLLGGNFSVINRLIGTPYLPQLQGSILFLEDVTEPPYRIDGMFNQLRLAGILDEISGLVIGGFTDWDEEKYQPTLSMDEVLMDYLHPLDIPVATDLAYGHFELKNTMPIGISARLEVSEESAALHLLEPAVTDEPA